MGTLYWVSKKKIYQMGSLGNLIFLVLFSIVVLAKPQLDHLQSLGPTKPGGAFCNRASCPNSWWSRCLCCKFRGFMNRCRKQCQHPNICDANKVEPVDENIQSPLQLM